MLAVPNLVGGEGITLAIKAVLLAAGGSSSPSPSTSSPSNAVRPLRPLTIAARPSSRFSRLPSSGSGFSPQPMRASSSGVDRLVVEQHGEELGQLIRSRRTMRRRRAALCPRCRQSLRTSRRSMRASAKLRASGYSGGGDGPAARLLLEKLGRAQALQQEVQRGEFARDDAVQDLSALYAQYRSMSRTSIPSRSAPS